MTGLVLPALAWAVAGIAAGCLPPAVPIGRLWGVDVLRSGTSNPGVSNVRLLAGMFPAVLTFLADLVTGVLAPLVPAWLHAAPGASVACALGAVAGRAWSPVLIARGLRGGRAQMLILASTLVIVPWAAVVVLAVYTLGAVTRRMAIASLVNMAVLPVAAWVFYPTGWAPAFGIGVGVIGLVRRLQGSPDGRPASMLQRLLYDRERRPGSTVVESPAG